MEPRAWSWDTAGSSVRGIEASTSNATRSLSSAAGPSGRTGTVPVCIEASQGSVFGRRIQLIGTVDQQ